jgi:hypothetical protein
MGLQWVSAEPLWKGAFYWSSCLVQQYIAATLITLLIDSAAWSRKLFFLVGYKGKVLI